MNEHRMDHDQTNVTNLIETNEPKKANAANSIISENWSSGEENRERGRAWLDQIYKANHASTENTLAAHKDFGKWEETPGSYRIPYPFLPKKKIPPVR